ncbi:MAG: hypothetical protein HQK54_12720 [Oligoflexales bacterium]|nr:hypothetical protein [Oligoflexales bacterium]
MKQKSLLSVSGYLISMIIIAAALTGCGDKKETGDEGGPTFGKVETVFEKASRTYGIPKRLLLAVAFMESGFSTVPESVTYLNDENGIGFRLSETAFGISFRELGIIPTDAANTFDIQVDAYSKWVISKMKEKKIELKANPETLTDMYDWIWHLAQIHRSGDNTSRNVQIVFALELMRQLNSGAIWQDPGSTELIRLEPEQSKLDINKFDKPIQDKFNLNTDDSDIFAAQFFELGYHETIDTRNLPNHIKIIHCPFSLSACLELQNGSNTDDKAKLQAHYLITPDDSLVKKPLQVATHKSAVLLTDSSGDAKPLQDSVVIMLTGDSGRYIKGKRSVVNPKWFTEYQLKKMGIMVRQICSSIKKINDTVDIEKCKNPEIPDGVRFQRQLAGDEFKWGDIPDFDENIFWNYIKTPDQTSGISSFSFENNQKVFPAGSSIRFSLKFIKGTSKIIIEQLQRCPDQKVVWAPIREDMVRNMNEKNFEITIYDRGPNTNGQHFFRSTVFDSAKILMGWSIEDVYVENYEKGEASMASAKMCERNGT